MARTSKLRDFSLALPPGPARNMSLAVGVLTMVGAPIWFVYSTLADQQKLKAEWTIAGPPCPPPAPPPKVPVRSRGEHVFEYGGAAFSRRSGAVTCAAVPIGGFFETQTYPVCQFTAPGRIAVEAAGLKAAFEPGSQRATVTVRNGTTSCVLGGWFRASVRTGQ